VGPSTPKNGGDEHSRELLLGSYYAIFRTTKKGDGSPEGITKMEIKREIDREQSNSEVKNKMTRAERIHLLFNGIRTVVSLRHVPELWECLSKLLEWFSNLLG
jgi:hypothetical protein